MGTSSGAPFHVHGPHDHTVEHEAHHGGDAFAARIAVMTAIRATVGAIFACQAGATRNEAAIRKSAASDQGIHHQATGSRQNLAEPGAVVASGEASERMRREVERHRAEKEEIREAAE
jgi:hypothetical protein